MSDRYAYDVACDVCEAQPGEPCWSKAANDMRLIPHTSRRLLAAALNAEEDALTGTARNAITCPQLGAASPSPTVDADS